MPSIVNRIVRPVLGLVAVLLIVTPALALEPDEIALVVNAKVPEGRTLAELYARERHIPDGRIIALDLYPRSVTSPAEEMPFDAYDAHVAQPVRDFLIKNNLQKKVKCLVTFWGVPLRVDGRTLTQAEKDELQGIKNDLNDARGTIVQQLGALEQAAVEIDPSFTPLSGDELPQLTQRLQATLTAIVRALPSVQDPAARTTRFLQMISAAERLLGSDRTRQLMVQPPVARFAPHPPTPQELAEAEAHLEEVDRKIGQAQGYAPTAAGREQARTLARKSLGLFGYAMLLSSQADSFNTDHTEAALDSELALLWWQPYPRARWIENPLRWRVQAILRERHIQPNPMLMVTRLDGPSVEIVRNIILTSIKVEAAGLKGQVAIDARGRTGKDPYAGYDQTLRNLAALVREKTTLKVTLDDSEALIPAHSLKDIALYCGWYSLRNYSPPGSFSAGAVGFHVASFELVSLRQPGERGWVRGLLSDGVTATLGPVAEPYLQSFPAADEFFPLLMTGKLTLAEVYWRTIPLASWMQDCVGDPLYTPYKHNPPLRVEDLPEPLRLALEDPLPASPVMQPAEPAK